MLCDNLKALRKSKGLSQEELAIRLCVVRQTVSKWENGLSVPDSEMLVRIAETLDTSVSTLLGEHISDEENSELKIIAAKLELLNEQIAKRNEKSRRLQRAFFTALLVISVIFLILLLADFFSYCSISSSMNESAALIGGADGPTAIFVSSGIVKPERLIITLIFLILAVFGIYKTKK